MRCYIPPRLRQRFDIAWRMIPEPMRVDLRRSIVSVRAADSIKGARVRCKNGKIQVSKEEGSGWCVYDDTGRVYILLLSELQGEPWEVKAVYTALHEIAHAVEFLQDDQCAALRSSERSELAADAQVVAWASRDAPGSVSNGYKGALEVVNLAIGGVYENLKVWSDKELAAKVEACLALAKKILDP